MARAKKPPFTVDLHRLMEVFGMAEFIRQVGLTEIVNEASTG